MRKYLGAILAAAVIIALMTLYGLFMFRVIGDDVNGVRIARIIVSAIVVFVVGGVTIALISRIRELRKGQEDAIGKY